MQQRYSKNQQSQIENSSKKEHRYDERSNDQEPARTQPEIDSKQVRKASKGLKYMHKHRRTSRSEGATKQCKTIEDNFKTSRTHSINTEATTVEINQNKTSRKTKNRKEKKGLESFTKTVEWLSKLIPCRIAVSSGRISRWSCQCFTLCIRGVPSPLPRRINQQSKEMEERGDGSGSPRRRKIGPDLQTGEKKSPQCCNQSIFRLD